MWSHLCKNGYKNNEKQSETKHEDKIREVVDGETTELHRGFVYQLVSQLGYKKGLYISRRLNQSYGLLKLHTDRISTWVMCLIAMLLFVVGYILPEKFCYSLPILGEKSSGIESIMVIAAVVLFLVAVTRAEIVFSSNKSEGGRKIDTNDIMQIYRTYVLQHSKFSWLKRWIVNTKKLSRLKLINYLLTPKHYIVVVEDLDRTDDNAAVVNFLKELRKYYVSENIDGLYEYRSKVSFLVNVKPETQLCDKDQEKEEYGHLYSKLFDYVLNLQTINVDDYETILDGIGLDDKLAINYFEQIAGFVDSDAALAFVSGIEQNTELLRSDEIYDNTHGKLLDPFMKARYTRARTKIGCNKVT